MIFLFVYLLNDTVLNVQPFREAVLCAFLLTISQVECENLEKEGSNMNCSFE